MESSTYLWRNHMYIHIVVTIHISDNLHTEREREREGTRQTLKINFIHSRYI